MNDESTQVIEEPGKTAEAKESLLTGKDPTDTGQQESAAVAAEEGKSPEGDGLEVQGAPEQYEPFAMPEGMELDGEVFDEFQALAKEHNLPQAEAQKYADFGAKLVQKAQESTVQVMQEHWQETVSKWVDEIKTDKDLGGDKLPETLAVARKVIDTFGGSELISVLEETGMTNNPELLRFVYRIGKATSDDTFHTGKGLSGGSEKTAAQILFPTMQ